MKKIRPLLERTLLAVGLVCCGAWAYAWMDSHWFEARQSRRLDRALVEQAAARKESFASFARDPFVAPAAAEPAEGDLIGRLEIERLGVSALLLEGISDATLRRGVGRIPGTSPLTAAGNVGIAGHRDSFFRGLKDVGKGDVVELQTFAGTWRYRVEWTRIVPPTGVEVLDATDTATLTLVTCYPFYYIGSAPKRFIVRAERIEGPA